MSVWLWVGLFAGITLFTTWVVLGSGASWLEENWLAALLIDIHSVHWTAEQLRLYLGLAWLLYLAWFVFGLIDADSRTFWLL